MITNLNEAKAEIRTLLDLADGDAEAVYWSLCRARRAGRDSAQVTADEDAANQQQYNLLFLALADITGNAAYRA